MPSTEGRARSRCPLQAVALGLLLAAAHPSAPAAEPGSPCGAIPEPVSLSLSTSIEALESLYAADPGRAESLLAADIGARALDPRPLLARIKLAWWAIFEGRDPDGSLERRASADFHRLQRIASRRLRSDPTDPVAGYALGEAHCTLGRLDALRGRAWGAFRHHQRGAALLEAVVRQRPEAPEPRASLGVLRYYAARLPRSLRLLGRLVHLHGEREAGLGDLRIAAAAPGVQQVEAAFFLVTVLNQMEDENLEALALATRYHGLYPRHLGFTLELAEVLVDLERPDLAVRSLAAAESTDVATRVQCRLLAARIYLETGRPRTACGQLESLTRHDRSSLGWLEPWYDVLLGGALAGLDRAPEARIHLQRAQAAPEAVGSHAATHAIWSRLEDPLAPALVVAESLLMWDGDAARARDLLEAALGGHPAATPSPEFLYALGCAALRQGDCSAAVAAFERVTGANDPEDAWLAVRPRIRLLQSLLWAGHLERARALAQHLDGTLGRWGANRQLALLVEDILRPATVPVRLSTDPPASGGTTFRLRDTGFTSVELCCSGAGKDLRVPMTLRSGYWETCLPLAPGEWQYGFAIQGKDIVVDTEATGRVALRDGILWSHRRIGAPSS